MTPISLLGGVIVAQWKVNRILRAQTQALKAKSAVKVETEKEEGWDMVEMQD
jgi:hypothetical protein